MLLILALIASIKVVPSQCTQRPRDTLRLTRPQVLVHYHDPHEEKSKLVALGQKSVWGASWSRPVPLVLLLSWGWVANLHISNRMGIHLPSVIGKGHEARRVTLAVSTVTSLWLTGVFLVPYWGDSGLTIASTVDPGRHLAVLLLLLA